MSLSAFLAENAVPVENIKFVASKRFLGEDGNPIPWEIKTITGTEDEALRKSCAKRVPVPGKKNQYQKETDYDLYLGNVPEKAFCLYQRQRFYRSGLRHRAFLLTF